MTQPEYIQEQIFVPSTETNDLPLVSVIIRSMDRPTLPEALDSVAAQTYANIELVVINAKGGHHSNLGHSCGRLPLRLINDQAPPLTRSAAANTGLDAANGVFAIFLDDDDFILPLHIANLVESLSSQSNLIAVYSAVNCVDAQNKLLPQQFGKPFDKTRLMSGNFIPIHSVLFYRSAYIEGCRFDEALQLFEDWDFWLQLAELGDFRFLPTFTAYYRISLSGGFGVSGGNEDDALRATRTLVAKWQLRWSPEALYELMEANRRNLIALENLNSTSEAAKDLEKRIEHLESVNQQLQQELYSLNFQLKAVLGSKSWRFTHFFRYFVSTCRKLAKR